jgi:hypothetical protein
LLLVLLVVVLLLLLRFLGCCSAEQAALNKGGIALDGFAEGLPGRLAKADPPAS